VKVFISYSRDDETVVKSLVRDLERARVKVWLDEDLGAGQEWWSTILQQIRECSAFVFAVSDGSLSSKPCRAEWAYAKALRLPVLPVQIGEVRNYRADPLFRMQLADYRQPSAGFALMGALRHLEQNSTALPDPLPPEPPMPFEYLLRIGESVHDQARELSANVQMQMLIELRSALNQEDDQTVLDDIRDLLRALRARDDVSYPVANEIDAILPAPSPFKKRRKTGPKPAATPAGRKTPSTSARSENGGTIQLKAAGGLIIAFAAISLLFFVATEAALSEDRYWSAWYPGRLFFANPWSAIGLIIEWIILGVALALATRSFAGASSGNSVVITGRIASIVVIATACVALLPMLSDQNYWRFGHIGAWQALNIPIYLAITAFGLAALRLHQRWSWLTVVAGTVGIAYQLVSLPNHTDLALKISTLVYVAWLALMLLIGIFMYRDVVVLPPARGSR
jgi:hypothetical protein